VYLYDVLLDGEMIVEGSSDPECDLARALLARGVTGVVTVFDGVSGRPRTFVNIEKAAKVMVREDRGKGPCFTKFRTVRESGEGPHYTAEDDAPGVTLAQEAK
jgi:cytochrome oxidase Cu insertion factor (SCO1/SenC/PrrC family)